MSIIFLRDLASPMLNLNRKWLFLVYFYNLYAMLQFTIQIWKPLDLHGCRTLKHTILYLAEQYSWELLEHAIQWAGKSPIKLRNYYIYCAKWKPELHPGPLKPII